MRMRPRAPAACLLCALLLLTGGGAEAREPSGGGDPEFARTIPGVWIRFRDPLGNPTEVTGVLEREEGGILHVRAPQGRVHEVARSLVLETTATTLDPRTIYSAAELLERTVAGRRALHPDDPTLSSLDHWHVALHAAWLDAWEVARDHYARCAADEAFSRRVAAADQVARIDARLREMAAQAVLDQAALLIRMHAFRKARRLLEGFLADHPEASDALRIQHALVLDTFAGVRTQVFQLQVETAFPAAIQQRIRERVVMADVSFADVMGWTRRELPDDAFARVVRALWKMDDVSPEEALGFWRARRKRAWSGVTYGSGTFVVDPAPGAPPTRDAWWSAASTRERIQWTTAFFVERSGLYEVGERERRACALCRGTGRLSKTLPGGQRVWYDCSRCHGLLVEVVLRYR